MQLHIHVHGEGVATKENAPAKGARSKLNRAIKLNSNQRKVRAERRFLSALAATVGAGYLPLSTAYEILRKAHHDAK
jgi:hypothetical protein